LLDPPAARVELGEAGRGPDPVRLAGLDSVDVARPPGLDRHHELDRHERAMLDQHVNRRAAPLGLPDRTHAVLGHQPVELARVSHRPKPARVIDGRGRRAVVGGRQQAAQEAVDVLSHPDVGQPVGEVRVQRQQRRQLAHGRTVPPVHSSHRPARTA
jgi:hypothetical protein